MPTGAKDPAFAGSVSLDETRERDVLAPSRLALAAFLRQALMQSPPLGDQGTSTRRAQGLAWTHSVRGRSSARQEAALIDPIERQIEFGKTRRSELDGLLAVQDRLDQLGAQKREIDETPDIATRDAAALGQFAERSGASGGKLLEPS